MQQPDLRTREAKASQSYMRRKGYDDAKPVGVIAVEGQSCWYFYYDLSDCELELEVSRDSEWQFRVTNFTRK